MTRAREAAYSPIVFGAVVAFVMAVNLVRWLRPALLLDPEPSWAVPRLLLGLLALAATASAGAAAAALFLLWSRSAASSASLQPLPFPRALLFALALGVLALGVSARLASLGSVPEALWVDEVSEIAPALGLAGRWGDFADSIRPVPFGETPTGSVGVLYLELFRLLLLRFGTSVDSLRLPSALAGIASLLTTGLLARRLLPRGGAVLAMLILAGLQWHLTMSRLGWVAIAIAPVIDLAALAVLRARARNALVPSVCAGALLGAGAHVYLSAWVAAVALLAVALWPLDPSSAPNRGRFRVPAFFVAGFVIAVSPLFLFRAERSTPYFLRTRDQNVWREIQYWRSPMPVFEAAADGIGGPWLVSSSRPWPQNVRLGWVVGALVAVAFARALRRPRDGFSALILAHAGAALAATVLGGHRGVPNGFRFGYLSDLTAVAAAGGALWLLAFALRARRAAAIGLIGILFGAGIIGAGRMFREYGGGPGRDPSGRDTLVGRSALRWQRHGAVDIDPRLIHFPSMIAAIRRYGLDPAAKLSAPRAAPPDPGGRARRFRIVPSGEAARPGERTVEIIGVERGPVILGMLESAL